MNKYYLLNTPVFMKLWLQNMKRSSYLKKEKGNVLTTGQGQRALALFSSFSLV